MGVLLQVWYQNNRCHWGNTDKHRTLVSTLFYLYYTGQPYCTSSVCLDTLIIGHEPTVKSVIPEQYVYDAIIICY